MLRLTRLLMVDGSSRVAVAIFGWSHPASREWQVVADLFDAFREANFKKPKPYPRPWPDEKKKERIGTPIAPERITEVMQAFGRDPLDFQPPV